MEEFETSSSNSSELIEDSNTHVAGIANTASQKQIFTELLELKKYAEDGYQVSWLHSYLRYTFSSNHNIHKNSCGVLIKGSGAQKQWSHEFLWMLWFDEKYTNLF